MTNETNPNGQEPLMALPDHPLANLVFVPAGKFIMGDNEGYSREKPAHEVYVKAFYIGKYLITNTNYQHFVRDTGYKAPHLWRDGKVPPGLEKHPVVCVSWQDAMAYCEWLSRLSGRQIRLPTEAEWEKAASWDVGVSGHSPRKRRYPWGDEFDKSRCNTHESEIGDRTPVGKYSPQDTSPYGCADMAGNVWEWTSSTPRDYPYRVEDECEDRLSNLHVLRGGSFFDSAGRARCASRDGGGAASWDWIIGFRVAADPIDPNFE